MELMKSTEAREGYEFYSKEKDFWERVNEAIKYCNKHRSNELVMKLSKDSTISKKVYKLANNIYAIEVSGNKKFPKEIINTLKENGYDVTLNKQPNNSRNESITVKW